MKSAREIFEIILAQRGISTEHEREAFINPNYNRQLHDPFLLNGMDVAVKRMAKAKERGERVVIYGDYDVDGLTASTVLVEAFRSFGIQAEVYIPDRFEEGYGLNTEALKKISQAGASLVVTVDCGSVSHEPINWAAANNLDVIVTDHHTVGDQLPQALAVINPKRQDNDYPFTDLAGVGVAFKLVQALQTVIPGLDPGQEKWLLDLVALGTICDVVDLVNENRCLVYWGLHVMRQGRRPGLAALALVSGTDLADIDSTTCAFRFGPRLNAAGRVETAYQGLALLQATNKAEALDLAQNLDKLNYQRQVLQKTVLQEAIEAAEILSDDPVIIVGGKGWSQGVVGIVAAKLLEQFAKPAFVFEISGDTMKGSARSFGDFSAVEAVRAAGNLITKGGGHKAAAGMTLSTSNFSKLRKLINDYYHNLGLPEQSVHLKPRADVELTDLSLMDWEVWELLDKLHPFGNGNKVPVFLAKKHRFKNLKVIGNDRRHIRLTIVDQHDNNLEAIGFDMAEKINSNENQLDFWFCLEKNVFNGRTSLQARLVEVAK